MKKENEFVTENLTVAAHQKTGMYFVLNPTANCQISSVGSFNSWIEDNFIDFIPNDDEDEEDIVTYSTHRARIRTQEFFVEVYKNYLSKPILLFDVNDEFESWMDYTFSGYIISKQPYMSTNTSDMIIYLVNMKDFITREKFK
ncbi:hypothetical protein [Leptolyngbya phage Lbo-JY46]